MTVAVASKVAVAKVAVGAEKTAIAVAISVMVEVTREVTIAGEVVWW